MRIVVEKCVRRHVRVRHVYSLAWACEQLAPSQGRPRCEASLQAAGRVCACRSQRGGFDGTPFRERELGTHVPKYPAIQPDASKPVGVKPSSSL